MLDMRFIRENDDLVRESHTKRGDNDQVKALDELLKFDIDWRRLKQETDSIKMEKNKITSEISQIKDADDKKNKIDEMRKLSGVIAKNDKKILSLREAMDFILLRMPNVLDKNVPKGDSDEDNKILREWGDKPEFNFKPKNHIDIAEALDLVDIESAAKVSGARFYYLKNELVELEFALIKYVMDVLKQEGFDLYTTPALVRSKVMQGSGFLPAGEEDIYKVVDEDLYLVGTSEQSLSGLHMGETIELDKPKHYCGYSTCFRTEAGSHGKDTKGIFRVHQFDKIEMFVFCKPEESSKEHEYLLELAEKIYNGLGIPYRVVDVCTGEMGVVAARKYDIEAWMPSQDKYREIVSCSNCTAYQAVGLNIKYREDGISQYVNTLNSTACAISRTLVAIIENYQTSDGTVKIPEVLHKYLDFNEIKLKK
ncbi:serine--tRNA ligase [archaeon]|nr:serine--tRNA ligase [archaeon]